MKVLYLINFAGKAGTEKYVENLVGYLHGKRCECSLCYNVDGPLAEKMRARGVPTYRLEMKSPFDMAAAKKLADICRENHIDLIHAQYPRENYIALLSQKYYSGTKVVFTSHLTIRQPLPWKITNRIMTPKNHRIISVCNEGRDIMIQNGVKADRIEVIFNGIDASLSPKRDRSVLREFGIGDEAVFMIMARCAPEKGLSFLVDCVRRLAERTEVPFKVLIAGDGELFGDIKKRIDESGLSGVIIQAGFRTDTPKLLAASDIYLNTSSSNEALSFAILESFAASLPLVATEVGGNRDLAEIGGQCGFITNYGDVVGFSDAMQKLLEDTELRAAYGETALHKANNEFGLFGLLDKVYETYL